MGKIYLYSNQNKQKLLRKFLRQSATFPEILLWSKLRRNQMGGYKFRRQFQIGKYIVDFYCEELKLIIELDGSVHFYKSQEDKERQKCLEGLGYAIVRYTNEQVLQNILFVLDDMLEVCKLRQEILNFYKSSPY